MIIIAHRGFWADTIEQNTIDAFNRALDFGFGIELDVRDFNKKIIISHNIPDRNAKSFKDIFKTLHRHPNFNKVIYAINIKSDGIEEKIKDLILDFDLKENSFVFDMSMPSMYIFYKQYKQINFATRQSEVEKSPIFYNNAKWLWMDELEKHWISNNIIMSHIVNKKRVCLVSPELHERKHLEVWKQYLQLPKNILKKVYICTDIPRVADNFFNGARKK